MYIAGILTLALGTVLFTKSHMGVSATVSVPYTLSLITPLSLGMCTTFVYAAFVILELLLYQKMEWKVVLQIPFSFLYGYVIDFYDYLIRINPSHLVSRISCMICAIVATSLGVAMMVKGDYIVNPPAGIIQALGQVIKKDYGITKRNFDLAMVVFSGLVGFMASGKVLGIGIGTVVAVFAIGTLIRFFDKHFLSQLLC